MNGVFSFYAGLMASALHVLTGPDHMAAVTPFVIESKKKAWKIGLFWGLGHLAGMFSIGLLFLIFKDLIPVAKISDYSEQLVGIVLIGIGAWSLFRIFYKNKTHKHLHVHIENQPIIHKHKHEHLHQNQHTHVHKKEKKQGLLASFSIGFMHGLAGVAHFLIFLPVLSFESNLDSVFYIFGFMLGIIIAMTSFALVLGRMASSLKNGHNDVLFKGIRLSAGLFAIIVGVYWLIKF